MAYIPGKPPVINDPVAREILSYITRELDRVGDSMEEAETFVHFSVLHRVPAKLSDGILAFADGSDWDPGSGRGLYLYNAGAWELVHAAS